ncbi:MAG: hypothetical protein HYS23_08265 [Geobacter sp.]|nr:hypothetical protein [Geobacter sp.]
MRKLFTQNLPAKLIALVLALLLWFYAAWERNAEQDFRVTLELKNLPVGLAVAGKKQPPQLDISVAGPRILLKKLEYAPPAAAIDIARAREGTSVLTGFEKLVKVPPGLTVTRVYPASIEIKLEKSTMQDR